MAGHTCIIWIIFCLAGSSSASSKCPVGWTSFGLAGRCFMVVEEYLNKTSAQTNCERYSARLAIFDSFNLHILRGILKGYTYIWIGTRIEFAPDGHWCLRLKRGYLSTTYCENKIMSLCEKIPDNRTRTYVSDDVIPARSPENSNNVHDVPGGRTDKQDVITKVVIISAVTAVLIGVYIIGRSCLKIYRRSQTKKVSVHNVSNATYAVEYIGTTTELARRGSVPQLDQPDSIYMDTATSIPATVHDTPGEAPYENVRSSTTGSSAPSEEHHNSYNVTALQNIARNIADTTAQSFGENNGHLNPFSDRYIDMTLSSNIGSQEIHGEASYVNTQPVNEDHLSQFGKGFNGYMDMTHSATTRH